MDNSGGIGSLLQFIPGFLQLMHGINNSGQKQTAAQLSNVNNAMVNPNNPLYQQMYGQYKQQGQQQLGENISQMQGYNRMQSAMGRTPLFAPERQGEQAFRAQAAAGPQIGIAAGQETQQALQNASRGLMGAGMQGGVNEQLLKSQYSPQRLGYGATGQTTAGLADLSRFLGQNNGVNAPGAQQGGGNILSMLFGGQQ